MAVILRNSGRVIGNTNGDITKWTRPSDWLDMPVLNNGDEKIHLLVKIYEGNLNYLAFKVYGDYEVDWGDGSPIESFSSGVDAQHEILWDDISSTTLTSGGYRQAIVTITPQAGAQLTRYYWHSNNVHPDDVYSSSINDNIISVKMAGQNFSNLYAAFFYHRVLEEFEFVGTNVVTNFSSMFGNATNLKKVIQLYTSSGTNFSSMFSGCNLLLELPQLDVTNATNIGNMFQSCASIEYIPPLTFSSVTSLSNTFSGCRSLKNVPITSFVGITSLSNTFNNTAFSKFEFDLPDITSFYNTFNGNDKLEVVNMTIPNGQLTNCEYLLYGAPNVKVLKPFDTSQVTSFRGMFYNYKGNIDVNWVDTSSGVNFESMFLGSNITDVSWLNITSLATNVKNLFKDASKIVKYPTTIDVTNCSDLSSMFENNSNLKQPPNLVNTNNVTNTIYMFESCYSLEVAPTINGPLTASRQMFDNCFNLSYAPAYNLSGVTSYPNGYRMFYNCYNLRGSDVTGIKTQHSYQNCQLSRDAIVNIFNNLGVNADGRSIYVNNNPGSANLTAGDIAIATGKGWTVVS